MSSSRSGRSGQHGSSRLSGSGRSGGSRSIRQLIESLETHRVNTLTELCRIERVAASCESADDARAFQGPMTSAWAYYVTSHQMLSELRGLTGSEYFFSSDLLDGAQALVQNDPESNRSWNLAWLCLNKIIDDNLIPSYAYAEASRPEMWDGYEPSEDEIQELAARFQLQWDRAVRQMLQHWQVPPQWY
ncbi:hypothetical protein B0T26DRAFT_680749 [Lasiosphaeria miniovina]|uniref:Uncharacterized protein n=1 Tax=Lasiosphaeria miniovina TaxID=1954250 RepID=A0AA39ZSY3_9PEZI|nr:uncharacterized protein B0T26DRAFT_680749 [Lasiosphaeria miniovina]KAK0702983.1 hypothetical protein B0T26DRAFT_680749 [Lasiosphaeria miniovina]